MKMKTTQLYAYAKQYAQQYWGLTFNLRIVENGRLGRARARFVRRAGEQYIDFNPEILKHDSEENILMTLKHEVCHWAVYNTKGHPYHKDGHPFFESELVRIGSHSTGTVGATGNYYHISCSKCGREMPISTRESVARRRLGSQYTTKCCKAPTAWVGLKTISRKQEEPKTAVAANVAAIPAPVSGTMTASDVAAMFKLDPKVFRKKLRNAGYKKEGSGWTFTQEMIKEIKSKLGL
jgi:predicted SprT family Zn-dependent metalloprotease